MPDFAIEDGFLTDEVRLICGVDEAGRAPLAGPVVAAAVLIEREKLSGSLGKELNDSKLIKKERRIELFEALHECATIAIGQASVEEIDRLNIFHANLLAMKRAVEALPTPPHFAVIDGTHAPELACGSHPVVRGDLKCLSVAAASIVAKVTRDTLMAELAREHPGYGWERNAGYGTKEHIEALNRLGVAPPHRRSFAPIRKILSLE